MADSAETINITICGDGGCGKSSITLRLVRSQWTHEYDPTIEDCYSVTRTVDGLPYLLSLTDTAGQEEYRGLWAAANLKSDAFLLVYDITSASSLTTLDFFLDMIDVEAEQRMENNARLFRELGGADGTNEQMAIGSPPPVKIMAGNKCDLKEARAVTAQQGLEYARKRGCGFMETSAREMVNIEETFALIVRRVVEARQRHRQQHFPQKLNRPNGQLRQSQQTSSQHLFPASLLNSSQAISHATTPPLTAEERKFNRDTEHQDDPSAENSPLRGIGRALSRRVSKLKRSKSMAFRKDDGDSRLHEESTIPEEPPIHTPKRSKSVPNEKDEDRSVSRLGFKKENAQSGQEADRTFPWWKRMLC